MAALAFDLGFTLNIRHSFDISARQFRATRRHQRRLFDHIVGGRKEGRGYFEAQGFRGPRIDNQFVLAGRLYRQLARLCASQDAVDVIGGFLSIITGTTGWFLAKDLGLLDVPWPQFGWVAAALALVVLMTIQGLGYLLPTNLWVCIQLRRPDPDLAKISRTMRNYFFAVGAQGTMQVLTIVIMARFVTGL